MKSTSRRGGEVPFTLTGKELREEDSLFGIEGGGGEGNSVQITSGWGRVGPSMKSIFFPPHFKWPPEKLIKIPLRLEI